MSEKYVTRDIFAREGFSSSDIKELQDNGTVDFAAGVYLVAHVCNTKRKCENAAKPKTHWTNSDTKVF